MAKMRNDTTADWKLYDAGVEYNRSLDPDYYIAYNRNERFYADNQWAGIKANGLPLFVLNMFKRVINHFVSSIMSRAVKMQFVVENTSDTSADPRDVQLKEIANTLSKHSEAKWEKLKIDAMLRDALLDAALSGDMAAYTYWDDTIDTGQTSGERIIGFDEIGNPITEEVPIMGDFITELVDGCNVMLGNVHDRRINVNGRPHQPYIILAGRDMVSKLRDEAKRYQKENGLSDDDIENMIGADEDYNEQAGDYGKKEIIGGTEASEMATYVIKLWHKDGKIMFNKSVKSAYIRKDVDTELHIYPVAWNNWDKRKNSYHGHAVGTGLIENQIQINSAFAKVFKWMSDMAFPKTVYNKNLMDKPTNRVNEVIGVDGDSNTNLANVYFQTQPSNMAGYVIKAIELAISLTKEMMGVSDAALGEARAENTSAIMILQKASDRPLENIQSNLYQFVEDIGYIWTDFILSKYKIPRQLEVVDNGKMDVTMFDPASIGKAKFRIKIDVGPSTYWSEVAAVETLDNLFKAGIINSIQLLERYPNGTIPRKEELIEQLKIELAQKQQMEQMLAMAQQQVPIQ